MVIFRISILFARCYVHATAGNTTSAQCLFPGCMEGERSVPIVRAHTPKNEVFSSQYLMLPAERACSN